MSQDLAGGLYIFAVLIATPALVGLAMGKVTPWTVGLPLAAAAVAGIARGISKGSVLASAIAIGVFGALSVATAYWLFFVGETPRGTDAVKAAGLLVVPVFGAVLAARVTRRAIAERRSKDQ